MSYELFKQNMLSYMQNQKNIGSKEDFAKKLVQEYDALIKRGFDTQNGIKLEQGNTKLMETTLVGVLNVAFQQKSGEHAIITNLGTAFKSYWSGATMSLISPPTPTIIPPTIHIAQTSNFITNPGIWNPTDVTIIPPKPIKELLQEIPDDNNTVEGATAVVAAVGSTEILSDDGEDAGPQVNAIKQVLNQTLPPPPETSTAEEISVQPNDSDGTPIECGSGLDYEKKLSPNFKIRNLSLDVTFPHKIKAQAGLSVDDIVCNLKAVAENILEPLTAQFPNYQLNSAFRGKPSLPGGKVSQHEKGEAIDVQFKGLKPRDYLKVSEWVVQNLPFDQIIFEHGKSIWLHISHKRGGGNRKKTLTMLNGKYESGIKCYYA